MSSCAASCSTFCPAVWSASGTSVSSPTADGAPRLNAAVRCSARRHAPIHPSHTSSALPACSGTMLVVERMTRAQLYFRPSLIPAPPRRCSVDSS